MKQKKNKNVSSDLEMGNLFKITLVILVVFGIFYVLTYYVQKNKKSDDTTYNPNTITTIQYDEILMGNILNLNGEEYYVLLIKKEDYNKRYKKYLTDKNNSKKFYYSYIDNGLNSSYISDSSNLMVENIQDLKVSDISLLKIKFGKIIETYEGNAEVMRAIINLNK